MKRLLAITDPKMISSRHVNEKQGTKNPPDMHTSLTHWSLSKVVGILQTTFQNAFAWHDDVTKWKHFLRNWPSVRGIHRSPVNSPHKGQWRGALMFPLICVWINVSRNTREAGDLRRHRAHYDVTIMIKIIVFYFKLRWSLCYRIHLTKKKSVLYV